METTAQEHEEFASDSESPHATRKANEKRESGNKGLLDSYKEAKKLQEEEARWEAEKRRSLVFITLSLLQLL